MNFIFIPPPRKGRIIANYKGENGVRVSFLKIKGRKENYLRIAIYLGKNIAKKINLSPGNKVIIGYDREDHRKILLKKAINSVGYTIQKEKPSSTAFQIQLTWACFLPNENEMNLREVPFEYFDDGILLTL